MRPQRFTLYRPLGFFIVKPLLTVLLRPQVSGRRRIPRRGGCILVANHESPIDPFVLGLATRRVVRYVAKAELFRYPLLRPLLRAFGTIPINRGDGDRDALSRARALIARGAVVGIFPQGTCLPYRHRPFQRGAARLALETGVPVVPVALVNTERVLPPRRLKIRFPRVRIVIGEPIRVGPARPTREAIVRLTEQLEQAVDELRRPYGEPAHAWLG
jgi:1-acyl-sn-glycerol-3-phosphate acyltransferase